MKVVGGSASVPLARGIAKELGATYVDVAFEKHPGGFPDGERYIRLLGPVAGDHVVLVQTTCPDPKIAGAPLPAPIHTPDILSMFPIRTREISGIPAVARHLHTMDVDMLLAPDGNAIRHVKEAAAIVGKPYDYLDKERIDSYTVRMTPKELAVKGKSVAIVDDVISTGGTIVQAAKELKAQGARRVIAACVHGLFVGKAAEKLKACDEVIATDTVTSPYTKVSVAPEFEVAIKALG